jgi:tRNA A-37 threonylcarbamoyl transferase component Bud32
VSNATGPGSQNKDVLDTVLATRALQERLITQEQLQEAMAEQARDLTSRKGGARPLGAILVARGFLTHAQLQGLILAHGKATVTPPPMAPFGKYKLVRELGRGGMGIVYEAIESGLGRKVALKMMIVSPHTNPKDAKMDEERFLREAQLSASLTKHPNIVGVYEVGVIDGRRYLAMELIDGKPMSDWHEGEGITLRQEVEVLRAVALAVHHAHEHDVIHRDLKPQNILIDAKSEPHVTDFGLAKMVGENLSVSLTGAGMVVGTPAYISPEQAQGLKSTDRRTDVYALGVMLFEIITGRHPFTGGTAMEILMKASKNPVPSASAMLKVRLSPVQAKGLDDICQKALAKKANDRYRTAAAFAADLEKWLQGEEVKVALQTRRMAAAPSVPKGLLIAGIPVVLLALVYILVQVFSKPGVDPAEEERRREEVRNFTAERRAAELEREKLAADRKAAEDRAKAEAMKTPLMKAVDVRNPNLLRQGLVAEYYWGTNFDICCVRKIEPEIAFNWRGGLPFPDGPAQSISIRWQGYIRIPEKATYVFSATATDGARVFVDGTEVLSNWMTRTGAPETGVLFLDQGLHTLVLEYFRAGHHLCGVWLNCKKANDPAAKNLDATHYVHDGGAFEPMERKGTMEYADRATIPGAQEFESLPILESQPGATFVLGFWSRGKGFLVWGKNKPGDRLKFQFESPEAGEKTLILALARAKNAGIFRIAVNGTVLVERLDTYHPNSHFLEHEYKRVTLRKGANELEFTLHGSNKDAVPWNNQDTVNKLSLDYLRIR